MVRPYLEVNNLIKRYGTRVILDIENLIVNRGEVLAIIGPNGAGKSTLLRVIACLEKPNSGRIKFLTAGNGADELSIRRRLAMVFQEPLLFAGTVFENIAYGLKVRKMPKAEISKKVQAMAGMLGVAHLLRAPSGDLSGGEAQRVSLARALILEPELLLLDEPMASLDPPTKDSLLTDLRHILNDLEMTVIYITHERTEAVVLADRMAIMDEGRIAQIGKPREIMDYPVSRRLAGFVGVENILDGKFCGLSDGLARIKVNGSEIEAAANSHADSRVWALIRPENISIVSREPAHNGNGNGNGGNGIGNCVRNKFGGIVKNMVDTGMVYRVTIDCGFPLTAFVARQSAEAMSLKEGRPVWASFNPEKVHVVPHEGDGCER